MSEDIKEPEVLVDEEGNILTPKPGESADQDDQEVKAEERSSEESHEDEPAIEGETEDEAEARRERNRRRRMENKARRRDYIESLKREIAARDEILQQQAQRLDAIERRAFGADMAAVNAELQKAVDAYNYFKSQHAEAVSSANGELATQAFENMHAALQRAQQLDAIRQAATVSQRRQAAPQPLDPRLKMYAESWLERNPWYDPDGKDMDSRIALTIDQELYREGWNPTTEQYWEELDARLKKYLPHRYNSGYNKSQGKPRVPVAGSGKETSTASLGSYKLSPERVKAIKDAGKWDDPKERMAMIKAYQQYDKEHANG
jgi:hypothetical protein